MQFTKRQVVIVFILGLLGIGAILLFLGVIPGLQQDPENVFSAELSFWILGDNASIYQGAFDKYKQLYPGVTINYRTFLDESEYERELIDALAAGQGPDVFSIPNRSFYKYQNKIVPASLTQLPLVQLRQFYPQTVEREFISEGGVYGLPLSIDTLALFYNRDLLDQEGVVPPATWEEFQEAARKLTRRNARGEIVQAGAAIGGSEKSVRYASDILSALMLQTGVYMTDSRLQSATFASNLGYEVLKYYTHFATPNSKEQVWSEGLSNSIDQFAQERVAMIFAYQKDVEEVRKKNPYLNYGIAGFPQPKDALKAITYPDYRVYTVSKQTKYPAAAWGLLITLTAYPEAVLPYLEASGKPPALRIILSRFANDVMLSVFARQTLTALAWPQVDPEATREILSRAISEVVVEGESVQDALSRAQTAVSAVMRRRLQ